MTFKYTGIFTALITPFKKEQIDQEAFINLIKMQVEGGVSGVVIAGTTGESATLSLEEKIQLILLAKKTSQGKIKIIAGTGSNDTRSAILQSKEAQKAGADGLIIVTPYYNRPSQEGLYRHYKAINDEVNIPIMLYTVTKRTGVDFSDETIIRLSSLKNITAIKDATDDLNRPIRLSGKVGDDFNFLTGDDVNFIPYSANGGVGSVSVASNILPKELVTLSELINANKSQEAIDLQNKLLPLYNVMFCETNPTPVKYAASLLNLCYADVRLPLVKPEEESRIKIKEALMAMGLEIDHG